MGCFWGHWVTIDGRPVCIENKGIRAIVGTAVFLVVSAVAGGGAGTAAAAASESAGEVGINANTARGQTEVRIKGSGDRLKATLRLRRLGRHPTRFQSQSTKDCASYSSGEVHAYLTKHKCISLNRTFVETGEKSYEVQFSIATIEMPDDTTAADLHALLVRDGAGNITPLFPKDGKYRHIPITAAPPSKTTLHDDTVINIQGRGLGGAPSAALVASLATSVLFSLDTM